MEDTRLELTVEEYLSLEAHDWKKQELQYKTQITKLQAEVSKRDVALLNQRVKDEQKKQQELIDRVQTLAIDIKNIEVAKGKISAEIEEKYDLPDDWGYDPNTLEIILGE